VREVVVQVKVDMEIMKEGDIKNVVDVSVGVRGRVLDIRRRSDGGDA